MNWFLLVISCITGLAFVIGVLQSIFASKDNEIGVGVAVVGAILTILFFGLSGVREVPTKSIGVPTTFGKVEAIMLPGLHWKMPWTTVNILDETIQTETFSGLPVKIGGQQIAYWNGTIQWRINDAGASKLFNNYNQSGTSIMTEAKNAIVDQSLETALNQVFQDYNPIVDISLSSTSGNSQFSTFQPKLLALMENDVGDQVTITRLLMKNLTYSSATASNIERIQQAYANTAIAKQLIVTNKAQELANAAIGNPTAAQAQILCLQIVQAAEKSGFTGLPATFSCQSGSSPFAVTGK